MAYLYAKSPNGNSYSMELVTGSVSHDFDGYQNHYAVFSNGLVAISYWNINPGQSKTYPISLWLPAVVATKAFNTKTPTISDVVTINQIQSSTVGGLMVSFQIYSAANGFHVLAVGVGKHN